MWGMSRMHCNNAPGRRADERVVRERFDGLEELLMQYVLGDPIEKYSLRYDDWSAEEEEQAEWDRKVQAGEIE